ncbi:hypothetical protein CEXT_134651 [Caerostris extrusa]|uniref:Uncharacterized protein n=1 Tax=Caerostris extrusa TaxID=172846 RepID=A0AAV4XTN9_CAEEX|nr:hypothetical protein CEXT_134651 [Caerostris extrusa]
MPICPRHVCIGPLCSSGCRARLPGTNVPFFALRSVAIATRFAKNQTPSLRFDDHFMRPNAPKISGVRVRPQRAVPGKGVKQVKQTVGVPSYRDGVPTPPVAAGSRI